MVEPFDLREASLVFSPSADTDVKLSASLRGPVRDENCHVLTQRLTWLTHSQNLEWSLFLFYSPSDRDVYLRRGWPIRLMIISLLRSAGTCFSSPRRKPSSVSFRTTITCIWECAMGSEKVRC